MVRVRVAGVSAGLRAVWEGFEGGLRVPARPRPLGAYFQRPPGQIQIKWELLKESLVRN